MREMTLMFTSDWLGPLLARAALDEVETMAIYGLLFWPSCEFVKAGTVYYKIWTFRSREFA